MATAMRVCRGGRYWWSVNCSGARRFAFLLVCVGGESGEFFCS